MTCTALDHCYPKTEKGEPCYCGKRKWGEYDRPTYAKPAKPEK